MIIVYLKIGERIFQLYEYKNFTSVQSSRIITLLFEFKLNVSEILHFDPLSQ